jgi:hypothetical protein
MMEKTDYIVTFRISGDENNNDLEFNKVCF